VRPGAKLDPNRTNLWAAEDWKKYVKSWKKADKPAPEHLPPGLVFQDAPFAPEMAVIPPGRFMMGSKAGEGSADERPQHEVTIPQAFAIGRFAVTFDEWERARAAGGGVKHKPVDYGWGRGRHPVIDVSWEDAQAYVGWLSGKTGKPYRLLSEAEWEYACLAGTETAYSFGESVSKAHAQFPEGDRGGSGSTVEVGSFSANDFGLYGMHGNVTEWCEDRWHEGYARKPEDLKQTGGAWTAGKSNYRLLRNGSWGNDPQILRAACRSSSLPGFRFSYVGFRVARTLLTS
jgi:formylglycine-generating enzyme required for sulfatase activity